MLELQQIIKLAIEDYKLGASRSRNKKNTVFVDHCVVNKNQVQGNQ